MIKTLGYLSIDLRDNRADRGPLGLAKPLQPKEKNLRIVGGRVCKVRFFKLLTPPPPRPIGLLCVAPIRCWMMSLNGNRHLRRVDVGFGDFGIVLLAW